MKCVAHFLLHTFCWAAFSSFEFKKPGIHRNDAKCRVKASDDWKGSRSQIWQKDQGFWIDSNAELSRTPLIPAAERPVTIDSKCIFNTQVAIDAKLQSFSSCFELRTASSRDWLSVVVSNEACRWVENHPRNCADAFATLLFFLFHEANRILPLEFLSRPKSEPELTTCLDFEGIRWLI